jgi:hypothetical protein
MTFQSLLLVCAFVSACFGVYGVNLGKRADGTPRKNPSWIALSLAFFFGSIIIVQVLK